MGHEEQAGTRFRFQSSLSESEEELEEELVEYTWISTNGGDGGWVLHGMIRVWNGVWNEMDLNF